MSVNSQLALQSEKSPESYFEFHPDLIVEVTNACNRACQGCYAANIIVNKDRPSKSAKFLDVEKLNSCLQTAGPMNTIAIRGGEPSLHPEINRVLEIASIYSNAVVLETHGRWIEPKAPLLSICTALGIYVKVSFDSMHGLSADQLFRFTELLKESGTNYLVAITESSYEKFLNSRSLCKWIPNDKIIFQKKAVIFSELIKPNFGVLTVDGTLNGRLSVKNKFLRGT